MNYIKKFSEVSLADIAHVGGKTASLGQMMQHIPAGQVSIPDGFAITAEAYWHVLDENNLRTKLVALCARLSDASDIARVRAVGNEARDLIMHAPIPDDLAAQITDAYRTLSLQYGVDACDVAVRSSATAEDLPTASFAGQQETFLHIRSAQELLDAYRACLASLFTDRAIVYRMEHQFDHMQVALSVGVQKMVRSDCGASGVIFTLETESGFPDLVVINASYGLGEMVVKGLVTPDEYRVFKPLLQDSHLPIVGKVRGIKDKKLVYAPSGGTQEVAVCDADQKRFCLSDAQIIELSRTALVIENYYSSRAHRWTPMDIEWALDGVDGKLYIVQARPETVHGRETKSTTYTQYRMKSGESLHTLVTGQAIGTSIKTGVARIIQSYRDATEFREGDILVTSMTDPDWVPLMRKAAAIITERGGRTSHAAIVSRELGLPAIVGAAGALSRINAGQQVTVDCSQGQIGYVYDGACAFDLITTEIAHLPQPDAKVMMNIADPDGAFRYAFLPCDGVGLARTEFIIARKVRMHPMAACAIEKVTDLSVRREIEEGASAYADVKDFFVLTLARGVASIAAAFYPKPVVVRFSDFKSNEYRSLLGGQFFEQEEENPMLGFRGASRYYHPRYQEAFALECEAMLYARTIMGFTNIMLMVPFVRTVTEAERVQAVMADAGLVRGRDGLKLLMMCEIPSNVILLEQFAQYYDGFSIGSNDLTQMTLGVDRDSELLKDLFDERNDAVKKMVALAIERAHTCKKPIGICGQAPSDYPEFAQFLLQEKIDSLSLNPDAIVPFLLSLRR